MHNQMQTQTLFLVFAWDLAELFFFAFALALILLQHKNILDQFKTSYTQNHWKTIQLHSKPNRTIIQIVEQSN